MTAPDGMRVETAYGFTNTLIKYLTAELTREQPGHVACCFDFALTSFRNELFPAYKSSREDAPPELEAQFALCQEASRALGVASFAVPDYEADDLIATLTEKLLAQGARVRVVSSDKDLSQLVTADGRVTLYDLARDREHDAEAVRERFGVYPEQIPDYLGLVGDAVDDLPGVPGVGPKGAAAALAAFGGLEAMPACPEEWAGVPVRGARRLGERIAAHREQALQVRELATLVREVPGLEADLEDLAWRGADRAVVDALFERLGWGRIATRIPLWA